MDKDFEVKEAANQLFGFFKRVIIQKDKDDEKRTVVTFEDPEGGQFVKLVKNGEVSTGVYEGKGVALALKYMADGWMSNHHDIVASVASIGGDALVITL